MVVLPSARASSSIRSWASLPEPTSTILSSSLTGFFLSTFYPFGRADDPRLAMRLNQLVSAHLGIEALRFDVWCGDPILRFHAACRARHVELVQVENRFLPDSRVSVFHPAMDEVSGDSADGGTDQSSAELCVRSRAINYWSQHQSCNRSRCSSCHERLLYRCTTHRPTQHSHQHYPNQFPYASSFIFPSIFVPKIKILI